MTYDIGIGRCMELGDDTVVVRLESVMVQRLSPGYPWQRPGTTTLRLKRDLCSTTRPPQPDQEVFIDRAALSRKSMGALDLAGNGKTISVDLRALLDNLNPQPSAGPQPKGSGARRSVAR
ncbi:MAG: hypothetical protein DWB45_02595 [Xanthomonadales bacterium]|nr:MAG: hypothetical protein F9K31_13150 [Dokdonella sp.]MBC6941604.1 hypothetical protein [Xanthomonadales bacterium]MCC6596104.1 hypothetical protein [Rhodanobacteraceae bacterium]MDL1868319.1 hypothetical protein [Gammaproteobacteria bacterium PRO6]